MANSIHGTGPTNADVSLENGSAPAGAFPQPLSVSNAVGEPVGAELRQCERRIRRANDSDSDFVRTGIHRAARGAKSGASSEIDSDRRQIETRVDRKNLDADDSQRDILAQRLLQEAKKSLADHDSVAAISLATKASTLLEPLPKLADSSIPSAP